MEPAPATDLRAVEQINGVIDEVCFYRTYRYISNVLIFGVGVGGAAIAA